MITRAARAAAERAYHQPRRSSIIRPPNVVLPPVWDVLRGLFERFWHDHAEHAHSSVAHHHHQPLARKQLPLQRATVLGVCALAVVGWLKKRRAMRRYR